MPWKKPRMVFDGSFCVDPLQSMAVNDWTNPDDENITLEFPDAFTDVLQWIWRCRASDPNNPIILCDNDVSSAFHLMKIHPHLVPLYLYTINGEYLGAPTGGVFGGNTVVHSFEAVAMARKQHANWLYKHRPDYCLARAEKYVKDIVFEDPTLDSWPFAPANIDSLNPTLYQSDGTQLAPVFPMHVDDNFLANLPHLLKLTLAASIVSLEDVLGRKHPHQPLLLSLDKLHLLVGENRLFAGRTVDTRAMLVSIAPHKRKQLLDFIRDNNWLTRKRADLRDITVLYGLLVDAGRYCHWARAQLWVLQELVRTIIRARYLQLVHVNARFGLPGPDDPNNAPLPPAMQRRLKTLISSKIARFVYARGAQFDITPRIHAMLRRIFDALSDVSFPWVMPIGHIVKRKPAIFMANDASQQGIGVVNHDLQIFCFVPLAGEVYRRANLDKKDPNFLTINALECVGFLYAYVMATLCVIESPESFPPAPMLLDHCDNSVIVGWTNKFTAKSLVGQLLLLVFAELRLHSPAGSTTEHIPGVDNIDPDFLSRPYPSDRRTLSILQDFPPESRAKCVPFLRAALQCRHKRATGTAKQAGTDRSRQIHFLWFCDQLHILDALFPRVTLNLTALNHIMAMFAIHLASGHTLQCKSIKSGTIGDYCYAAAQLILIFDQDDQGYARDPRKTPGNLTMSPAYQDIINEVKRWDGMPNQREPFTVAMYRYVAKRAAEIGDPDNLWAVCADFFGAGLYGGFRLSEWAQPNSFPKAGHFNPIADGPLKGQVKAFTSGDVRFFNQQQRRLSHDQALTEPSSVSKISCTFRIQKNNDNGKVKSWTRNEELLDLDSVTCWLAIIARSRRLLGPGITHLPLSVYKDSSGALLNVTESKISQIMQAAARAVYGFKKGNKQDDEDIQKFTSHSLLRVGACVILQSNDFPDYEIKRLLRWRSDTFKDYLRNLAVVSKKLNAAMAAQVHNK